MTRFLFCLGILWVTGLGVGDELQLLAQVPDTLQAAIDVDTDWDGDGVDPDDVDLILSALPSISLSAAAVSHRFDTPIDRAAYRRGPHLIRAPPRAGSQA